MEHVNFSDINTDDEKVKVFNMIIDELNSVRTANAVYNAEVDEYNKSLDKKGAK